MSLKYEYLCLRVWKEEDYIDGLVYWQIKRKTFNKAAWYTRSTKGNINKNVRIVKSLAIFCSYILNTIGSINRIRDEKGSHWMQRLYSNICKTICIVNLWVFIFQTNASFNSEHSPFHYTNNPSMKPTHSITFNYKLTTFKKIILSFFIYIHTVQWTSRNESD